MTGTLLSVSGRILQKKLKPLISEKSSMNINTKVMKGKISIASYLATAVLSFVLMGHSVWMESSYKGVAGDDVVFDLYFGEFEKDLREKDEKVNGMADFKALYIHENNAPVAVPLNKTNKSFQGKFAAKEPGFYQILAINDEREVQDWTKHGLTVLRPIEYQRSSFTAFSEKKTEKVDVQPYFFFDIVPDYALNHKGEVCSIFEKGRVITGKIYLDKKPISDVEIKVYTPDKDILTLAAEDGGRFSFKAEKEGTYLITSTVNDGTAGTFKGKNYNLTRHHISTTVNVE